MHEPGNSAEGVSSAAAPVVCAGLVLLPYAFHTLGMLGGALALAAASLLSWLSAALMIRAVHVTGDACGNHPSCYLLPYHLNP